MTDEYTKGVQFALDTLAGLFEHAKSKWDDPKSGEYTRIGGAWIVSCMRAILHAYQLEELRVLMEGGDLKTVMPMLERLVGKYVQDVERLCKGEADHD